jgi:hypothetical protein
VNIIQLAAIEITRLVEVHSCAKDLPVGGQEYRRNLVIRLSGFDRIDNGLTHAAGESVALLRAVER